MNWELVHVTTWGRLGFAVLAVAILTMTGQQAVGETVIGQLDIAGFDWVYDFDAGPLTGLLPDAIDLDENDVMDWTSGTIAPDGTYTVGGGVLNCTGTTAGAVFSYSRTAGQPWDLANMTYADGFTVEMRVRVNSVNEDATQGVGGIWARSYASPNSSNAVGTVWVDDDAIVWGSHPNTVRYAEGLDNTDDFHTFRLVQEAGSTGTYCVYRDGVLIVDSQECPYKYSSSNLDRLMFGDPSGNGGGNMDIDYIGFQKGPYAPVPEPTTLALIVCGALMMLVRRRAC